MGYLAGVITGGIAFAKMRSKIAYLLVFCYAWILFGLNTFNLDSENYQARFNGAGGLISEPIFLFLLKVFRKAGFRYQSFLFVYAFVCLALISVIVLKFSPYPAAVLFLYLIFPFCLETVQIRFFLAEAIVIAAACLILKYKVSTNPLLVIGYLVLIALATGIHYSAVFYLIFLVLFLNEERFSFIQYVMIPVLFAGVCIALPLFFELAGSFIGMEKANAWISGIEKASMTRVMRLIIVRGGMLFLCLIARHLPWREDVMYDEDKEANEFDRTLFLLTMYSMLFTLLEISLSSSYERLTRPGLLFGWIYISRRISLTDRLTKLTMWILMLGLTFVNFYTNLFMGVGRGGTPLFQSVFLCMFQNNALF